MKKGFTMIELIFVIVILGILASVAIPRLAGTRDDAEISSAIANLRTLVSDANVYYVTKGDLKEKGSTNYAKWGGITSVPLTTTASSGTAATSAADTDVTTEVNLKAGGKDCIGVSLVEKTNTAPAYIKFTKNSTNSGSGVCKAVVDSASVKAYLEAKIPNVTVTNGGAIPIGSTASIYTTN